ncbi:PEP-CTERM sorting domain-containing protein [Methyloversatilis discipulorum]|uniref:PEP-CTERM sorting domain-containing protein n=1 Tax=Methyloversatilis discipulorum TaxID=1119528 RepID=UPI003AF81981
MGFHRIPTVLATLGLTALLASAPAAATDVLLDFSGNICGDATDAACTNGAGIGQGYGDVAGLLDVSHRAFVTATGTTVNSSLFYWSTAYSDLEGVAWGGSNPDTHSAEFVFTPGAGYAVTLNSMDFGDYLNRNDGSSAVVLDLLTGQTLWSSGAFDAGTTRLSFMPGVSSANGLVLRFGPDSYNTGIDNISLTVSAVPEPGTWAMLAAGLGVIGALRRRRKAD